MHHQEQDARSLALHTAAVELMRSDEALIQCALNTLARWDTHVSASSKPLRDEWVRILQERDWELALSVSERGNQLRQASPVSCVLPNERRLEIIRATSKWPLPNATTRQAIAELEAGNGKCFVGVDALMLDLHEGSESGVLRAAGKLTLDQNLKAFDPIVHSGNSAQYAAIREALWGPARPDQAAPG